MDVFEGSVCSLAAIFRDVLYPSIFRGLSAPHVRTCLHFAELQIIKIINKEDDADKCVAGSHVSRLFYQISLFSLQIAICKL